MASLETRSEHVFNMHTKVHVDSEKVTHLYQVRSIKCSTSKHFLKVEPGASSTSYGIEIAKLAGFPAKTLKRSRDLTDESKKIETLLAQKCSYTDRQNATEVLAKIMKLANENKSDLGAVRNEILKIANDSNSSIVKAALKI